MRLFKFFFPSLAIMALLALGFPAAAGAAPHESSAQTYTVMVGLENPHQGIGVMSYFPRSVTIHKGDTVHWVQNSNEIHTVTFLAGQAVPPLLVPSDNASISLLMLSSQVADQTPASGGEYDGASYANSGIMGREPGEVGQYNLTFTATGTFDYVCLVHGAPMSGNVTVVGADVSIPSPKQEMAEGKQQMAEARSMIPGVVRDAAAQVMPPTMNPDGTMTYRVELGYNEIVQANYGEVEIDLMQFFPNKLAVRPGDNVTFELGAGDIAPHTATFLNGAPEPGLVLNPEDYGGAFYFNPAIVYPQGTGPLTRTGVYSSGLLEPGSLETEYSWIIGDISPGLLPFECLLHDGSGMDGRLMVLPKR